MLYHIRLLKYVRQSQLVKIKKRFDKICSEEKLSQFVKLGLLENTQEDIYKSTYKSLCLIKQLKYPTQTLPDYNKGKGDVNEINNTEVFIQALKLPDFIALLYPNFEYIRPDALLIRGTKEKYKLEFLEVEASKSNWNDWLENKRINYLRLAGEKRPFSYWVSQCKLLDLPVPDINKFCFSVSIIGKVNNNFGEGFNFKEELNV